jgi:uncharacterized sulfatase
MIKRWSTFCLAVFWAGVMLADSRPNLLFIIADDCTHRDIGCYGGQALTPNIDRLAAEGMKFNRCFQAAPMCSPTRHNIYTGLYPVKSGAYCNHTFVHDDVKSIVHYLKPLGYRVALSGKSHVGPAKAFPFEWSKNNGKGKEASVIDMASVDTLLKECDEQGQRFALFACSNEPHMPWTKGKPFRSKYDVSALKLRPYMVDTPDTRVAYRDYLSEISYFDKEVGQLVSMLKKHELEDNTLVMVVSEQGNNFPFAKWTCYDAGLGSAMIVRWPGMVEAGSETDAMVEYVDICPTFVEVAGGTPSGVLDGKSLLPILQGTTDRHKDYVYGLQTSRGIYAGPHHYAIRSIRSDRFKLILNLDPEAQFSNTINRQSWFIGWQEQAASGDDHAKWVVERFTHRPAVELYDVDVDPHEVNNLAELPEYAATVSNLTKRLTAWMQSQGDKGMETELTAFERMVSGNDEYKQWAKENEAPNAQKKHKHY